MKEVAVLGSGSWGTALSIALADRGLDVTLYGNSDEIRDEINNSHRNSEYLPGIDLSEKIVATTDIADAVGKPLVLLVGNGRLPLSAGAKQREGGEGEEAHACPNEKGAARFPGRPLHLFVRNEA